jgi:hypothetical protein
VIVSPLCNPTKFDMDLPVLVAVLQGRNHSSFLWQLLLLLKQKIKRKRSATRPTTRPCHTEPRKSFGCLEFLGWPRFRSSWRIEWVDNTTSSNHPQEMGMKTTAPSKQNYCFLWRLFCLWSPTTYLYGLLADMATICQRLLQAQALCRRHKTPLHDWVS